MPNSSGPRWRRAAAMLVSSSRPGVPRVPWRSTMPAMPHMAPGSDFGDRLDQRGAEVQVARGAALGLDVLVDALDLLRREAHGGADLGRPHPAVVRVAAQSHVAVGQGEVDRLRRL